MIQLVFLGFNFLDLGNDIPAAILSDQKSVYGSFVALFSDEAQRGSNYE
ncbi:unnamed protein product [Arabidopsis halleri]